MMDWSVEANACRDVSNVAISEFNSVESYANLHVTALKDEWYHETEDIDIANSEKTLASTNNCAYVMQVPTAGETNDIYVLRVKLHRDVDVSPIAHPIFKIRISSGSQPSGWHNAWQPFRAGGMDRPWKDFLEIHVSPVSTSTWGETEVTELSNNRRE